MPRPEFNARSAIALLAVFGVVLAGALALVMRPGSVPGTAPTGVSALGRRVLVVATHPDDEVLTAGGTISQLIASGAKVRVVIVTAGDAYAAAAREMTRSTGPEAFRALAEMRRTESMAAAADLGLAPRDVVRLGYADSGTSLMWDASWDASHTFTGRDGSAVVPYAWALRPGAPECGSALTADLAAQIEDFRPDTVISPDPRETNSDHAAVAAFTMLALDDTGFEGIHLTAIVHFKGFPRPTAYLPSSRLAPPPQLTDSGARWLALPLDAASLRAKTDALRRYGSQLGVADLGVYMRAFLRRNELYCLRAASVPATSVADARPAVGSIGTVSVTPPPVIASARPNPVRVLSLRMVRGPRRVWFGLVCAGSADEASYTLALRLPGAPGVLRRLDLGIADDHPTALAVDPSSITTADLTAVRDGDTMWVSVPASIFSDAKWALASCGASLPGYGPSHTPWVDVRP